jgi:hypothetical protein
LLKGEDAKPCEAGVLQGLLVFGLIHTESAGAAATGGDIQVAIDDLGAGQAFGFKSPQSLNQIACGEISWIAQPVVAIFFSHVKSGYCRRRKVLTQVAFALKDRLDQRLVF